MKIRPPKTIIPQKKFRPQNKVATINDIRRILKIQEKHLLSSKSGKLGKSGFLIHRFNTKELLKFIFSKKSKVYIFKGKNGGEAYLVGHFGKKVFNDLGFKLKVYSEEGKRILNSSYAYIQHIAIGPNTSAKRALELEKKFIEDAKKRGFEYVLGEIALEPFNRASFDFHMKSGGNLIASYQDSNNIVWGVLATKI